MSVEIFTAILAAIVGVTLGVAAIVIDWWSNR